MRLYYTTKAEPSAIQRESFLSLGGYISGTPVPNDFLNNLFGEITPYTIEKNTAQYIGLILKNDLAVDIANIKLWFTTISKNAYAQFKIAAVEVSGESPNQYIESIENSMQSPLYADFEEATEAAPIEVGDLLQGGEVGIWIKRELNLDNINRDKENLFYKENVSDHQYVEKELETEDKFELHATWD